MLRWKTRYIPEHWDEGFSLGKMQKGPVIGVLSPLSTKFSNLSYARISWKGKRTDVPVSGTILALRPSSAILYTSLQADQLRQLWKGAEVVMYDRLSYARVEHKAGISCAE